MYTNIEKNEGKIEFKKMLNITSRLAHASNHNF